MKTMLLKIVVLAVFAIHGNSLFSQVYFINTQGDTLVEIKDHGIVVVSDSLFVKILDVDTLTVNDRVGIGISPDEDMLHVYSDSYTYAKMETNNDFDAGIHLTANSVQQEIGGTNQYAMYIKGSDNSGNLCINEDYVSGIWDPTNRFCIQNETGFVGIGTMNPNSNIHLHSDDGTVETGLRITDSNSISNGGEVGIQTDRALYFWNYENSYLLFGTNNISRVWITENGDVGIGTGNPEAKLDVEGGLQIGYDSDLACAEKAGTIRYRETASASYLEMCMKTGPTTYSWVVVQ